MRKGTGAFLAAALLAVPLLGADRTDSEEERASFMKAIAANELAIVRTMLAANRTLAQAKTKDGRSAASVALFISGSSGFAGRRANPVLELLLAEKPGMDLYDVAAFGTGPALEALLGKDPGAVRARNPFGWTPLHIAAFAGNTATAEVLLAHGAALESRAASRFRNTPLQTALLPGELGTAKLLLEHGADVLVRQSHGFAPLHEAALLGRLDLIELLLAHGAELDARANDGRTALSEAVRGGHQEAVTFLRSKGANPGTIVADLTKEPKG
jgi:ankyrin repeat protein